MRFMFSSVGHDECRSRAREGNLAKDGNSEKLENTVMQKVSEDTMSPWYLLPNSTLGLASVLR